MKEIVMFDEFLLSLTICRYQSESKQREFLERIFLCAKGDPPSINKSKSIRHHGKRIENENNIKINKIRRNKIICLLKSLNFRIAFSTMREKMLE